MYLGQTAGASFDDPRTFAAGTCVAVFERVAVVPTTNITVGATTFLSNVFTARLVDSRPFRIADRAYDFRDIVGPGVSQWGTAEDSAAERHSGVPFVGSAIRIG